MTKVQPNTFTICLVEDNDDDVFLIRKAVAQTNAHVEIVNAVHGEALLRDLEERCDAGKPLPMLIMLDINMPRLDGFQVLKTVKTDERLRHLPMLILTTSSRREDIQRAFDLGACSFFSKPAEFDELVRLMEHILAYWQHVTRLPGNR